MDTELRDKIANILRKDLPAQERQLTSGKARKKQPNVGGGPTDQPIGVTKKKQKSKVGLVKKVIMEWVNRNGKMFLRRRTVMVRPDEVESHDKVVKVYLSDKHYFNPRWIEYAMATYGKNIKFTKKMEGYAVWSDPADENSYIIYKHHDDSNKTVLVYNAKLQEKVLIRVFQEKERTKQESLENIEEQQKKEGITEGV
jgi:hypothetical protein